MCRYLLVVCILAARPSVSQTLSSERRSFGSILDHDLFLFFHLTGRGLTAPLHWQGGDWKNAAGVMLATGVSSVLDDEAYDVALRNRTTGHNRVEGVFEAYSNGLSGILLSGVFYGAGVAFESEWLHGTGLIMASALTISAITQTTFKLLVGRARPYTGLGSHTFRPFSFNSDFVSFPSGHTIVAFTISTVLAERIDNVYASLGLYTAAVMSGLSRIYSGNHWLSDVVFGAGLAFSVARSVASWYDQEMRDGAFGSRTSLPGISVAGVEVHPLINRVVLVWRL